jgi:hypothetical protein
VNSRGEILFILIDDHHISLPVCVLRILLPLSQFFGSVTMAVFDFLTF